MSINLEELKRGIKAVIREELTREQNYGSPEHETIEEAVACPNCFPKIKQLVLKKTKNLDHECTECGLGVDGKESEPDDWKCPLCGNEYAQKREEE